MSLKVDKKKILKNLFQGLCLGVLLLPSLAIAQEASTITAILMLFSYWILVLVYIVMALALVFFLWGVVRYITAGDSEEGRRDARNTMLYGVIGLFVMTSVWGLVNLVGSIVGIEPGRGGGDSPLLPGEELTGVGTSGWFFENIRNINLWIAMIVVGLIGLALLYFLWGVTKYIASGADEEKRIEARGMIVYGILGLFAMVSLWGLVAVLAQTFNVGQGGGIGSSRIPQIVNIDLGGGNKIEGEAMTKCELWDPKDNTKTTFKAFVCYLLTYLNAIPPVLVALSMLYLFWGIAKYMGAGDAEELRTGRNTIIYGILAMFVLTSVWALVFILQKEFGLGS